MPRDADAAARRMTPYHALVIAGALPLVALAVFAYVISSRAMDVMVRAGNDASATITAAMMERESQYWTATLVSHAGFPTLAVAVADRDAEEVRARLEIFVNAHPRLDRAFVTDTAGMLWADHPPAPESHGVSFSHRDWFLGVERAQAPYVSEIYRRAAAPDLNVVAVAAPVLDPRSGDPGGYLVAQIRLDSLSDLLRRVELGTEGIVFVLDHNGALAAHPLLDVRTDVNQQYADLIDTILTDVQNGVRRGLYTDPTAAVRMMATAVPARVQEHVWTVVAQQPVAAAFAATRTLAWQLGGAGVLMAVLVGGLVWGLGRANYLRGQAEAALVALNRDLERLVEERTEALRQKQEEFLHAQKMEAVGRLAGGVAHDFNNLLTVIIGCTDLLLSRLPAHAPGREEIEQTYEAAERAASLTRQLLAFSRKQVMQPRVLDLNDVVQRMRGIIDRVVGEKVDVVWRLAPELHPVEFDPGQVEQIIMNLVVNASDAMPKGGKLTIETGIVDLDESYVTEHPDASIGPHVMLAISDTGSGMDADTRKRIFEPFYTTKQLGRGTGLGLSTVYGIVKQGGGNIWVYSEPGHGTTFKIYLPPTVEAAPLERAEQELALDVRGATVLVVEDEAAVRALLLRVLSAAGYVVLEAAYAEEARASAREVTPDMLLTDVILPDSSGPELAADLMRRYPQLKVLYMSGYTDNAIVHHGILDQETAFIQKPFRPDTILAKVREVLAHGDP